MNLIWYNSYRAVLDMLPSRDDCNPQCMVHYDEFEEIAICKWLYAAGTDEGWVVITWVDEIYDPRVEA